MAFGYDKIQTAARQRMKLLDPENRIDASFYSNEMGGECGEAQNVVKKLERERLGFNGSRDTVEHLAQELADVIICAYNVAAKYGIDLDAAIHPKFNAFSDKVGVAVRMFTPIPHLSGEQEHSAVMDAVRGIG